MKKKKRKKKYILIIKKKKRYFRKLYYNLIQYSIIQNELFVIYILRLKMNSNNRNRYYLINKFNMIENNNKNNYFYLFSLMAIYDETLICSNLKLFTSFNRNMYIISNISHWMMLEFCKYFFLYKIKQWKEISSVYNYKNKQMIV